MNISKTKYNINSGLVMILGYLYLAIPIIIFALGWMRWYYAVPFVAIVGICLFLLIKTTMNDNSDSSFVIDSRVQKILIIAFIIIVVWVAMSGIGKLTFQNKDHKTRNAIFEIMVNHSWPAIGHSDENIPDNVYGLVYYIGFWIVPALLGKVFGMRAGYLFQDIWAIFGIFIFYLLLCIYRKKIELWPLLIFVFFGGWDIIGYFVGGNPIEEFNLYEHIDSWMHTQTEDEFSAFTTQLFWVFNQAIPAWILTLLLFMQKNNKYIAFLIGISTISTILPVIGLLPFVIYIIYRNSKKYDKYPLSDLFSLQNIIGGGITGGVILIYMLGNTWGVVLKGIIDKITVLHVIGIVLGILTIMVIGFIIVRLYKYYIKDTKLGSALPYIMVCICYIVAIVLFIFGDYIGINIKSAIMLGDNRLYRAYMYGMFYILEVGVFLICIFWYNKTNPILYISALWLFICPMIRIGKFSDFCMRASIPALLCIYIMFVATVDRAVRERKRILVTICAIVFLIGSLTSIFEMNRTVYKTYKRAMNGKAVYTITYDDMKIFSSKNFRGKYNESFFFKYIAKQGVEEVDEQ